MSSFLADDSCNPAVPNAVTNAVANAVLLRAFALIRPFVRLALKNMLLDLLGTFLMFVSLLILLVLGDILVSVMLLRLCLLNSKSASFEPSLWYPCYCETIH